MNYFANDRPGKSFILRIMEQQEEMRRCVERKEALLKREKRFFSRIKELARCDTSNVDFQELCVLINNL